MTYKAIVRNKEILEYYVRGGLILDTLWYTDHSIGRTGSGKRNVKNTRPGYLRKCRCSGFFITIITLELLISEKRSARDALPKRKFNKDWGLFQQVFICREQGKNSRMPRGFTCRLACYNIIFSTNVPKHVRFTLQFIYCRILSTPSI